MRTAPSSQYAWVAQALIKARPKGTITDAYLVRRDGLLPTVYRLIGGRSDVEDADLFDTMMREMLEELGLEHGCDYAFEELIHELPVSTRNSSTFGVPSRYHYRVYWAKILWYALLQVAGVQWVTQSELFAGRTEGGQDLAAWHMQTIDQ